MHVRDELARIYLFIRHVPDVEMLILRDDEKLKCSKFAKYRGVEICFWRWLEMIDKWFNVVVTNCFII